MKAPLLIQIEGGNHTLHTFPNRAAYLQHIEQEDKRCKATGLKTAAFAAMRQPRKTDVLMIYRGNQAAPLPTKQQITAILKQYKEGAQ